MAASSEREPSPPPSLEELSTRGAATFLLPWIMSAAGPNSREILVFVHQPTRSITLMEASSAVDGGALLAAKEAPPPASKASIESLPRVRVSDPNLECPICLSEYELNDNVAEAKEMPCRHRFHSDCIEKWLAIRGSCPVCRLTMPPEEAAEDGDEREGWRVHVFFARGRTGSGLGLDSGRTGESGYDGDDVLPAQDMEMDDIN